MNFVAVIVTFAAFASFLWLWHYITRIIPETRVSIARHRIWKIRDRASLLGIEGKIPAPHAKWIVHISDLVIENCEQFTLWRFLLERALGPMPHSRGIQPPPMEELSAEQREIVAKLLSDLYKQIEALLLNGSISAIVIHKWSIARSFIRRFANVTDIGKAAIPLACHEPEHYSLINAKHA